MRPTEAQVNERRTSRSWKSLVKMLKGVSSSTPKSAPSALGRRSSSESLRRGQPGRLTKLDLLESPGTSQSTQQGEIPPHIQRVERWRNSSVPLVFPTRKPEAHIPSPPRARFQTLENGGNISNSDLPTVSSGRLAWQRTASPPPFEHRRPTSDMDGWGDSNSRMRFRGLDLSPFARSRIASESYSRPEEERSSGQRLSHVFDSHGGGRPQQAPRVSRSPGAATQRPNTARPHLSIIIPT